MSIKRAQEVIAYVEGNGGYDMRYLQRCAQEDRESFEFWLLRFVKYHEEVDTDTARQVADYYLYGVYPTYKKDRDEDEE